MGRLPSCALYDLPPRIPLAGEGNDVYKVGNLFTLLSTLATRHRLGYIDISPIERHIAVVDMDTYGGIPPPHHQHRVWGGGVKSVH